MSPDFRSRVRGNALLFLLILFLAATIFFIFNPRHTQSHVLDKRAMPNRLEDEGHDPATDLINEPQPLVGVLPSVYHEYIQRGLCLMAYMEISALMFSRTPQGRKSLQKYDYGDLKKSGWIVHHLPSALGPEIFDPVWSTLGVKSKMESLQTYVARHENSYTVGSKTYAPTHATYMTAYSREAKLLVVNIMYGPKEELKIQKTYDQLPPEMSQWWEVIGLLWSNYTSAQVGQSKVDVTDSLDNILMFNLHTDRETTNVINQALKDSRMRGSRPEWPGITFTEQSLEFKAILASPNVSPQVWLLAMNKHMFEVKKIDSIRIYWTRVLSDSVPTLAPNIVLHVVDVLQDGVSQPKDGCCFL